MPMTPDMQARLDKAMEAIKPEIEPLVNMIEARLETTRGHYGDYMALLSTWQDDRTMAILVRECCIRCGANRQGVMDAWRIVFG